MGKTYRRDSDRKFKNFGKKAEKAKKIREDFSNNGKHHGTKNNKPVIPNILDLDGDTEF